MQERKWYVYETTDADTSKKFYHVATWLEAYREDMMCGPLFEMDALNLSRALNGGFGGLDNALPFSEFYKHASDKRLRRRAEIVLTPGQLNLRTFSAKWLPDRLSLYVISCFNPDYEALDLYVRGDMPVLEFVVPRSPLNRNAIKARYPRLIKTLAMKWNTTSDTAVDVIYAHQRGWNLPQITGEFVNRENSTNATGKVLTGAINYRYWARKSIFGCHKYEGYYNDLLDKREQVKRGIDGDLVECLRENLSLGLTWQDIDQVLAVHEGERDVDSWHWVVLLKTNVHCHIEAGCPFSGWDNSTASANFATFPLTSIFESGMNFLSPIAQSLRDQVVNKYKLETWREKQDREFGV